MPFDVGVWEIVILLAVLALLFGTKEIPDVARRLGAGVREVRNAVGEVDPRRLLDADEERTESPRTKPTGSSSRADGADPHA